MEVAWRSYCLEVQKELDNSDILLFYTWLSTGQLKRSQQNRLSPCRAQMQAGKQRANDTS